VSATQYATLSINGSLPVPVALDNLSNPPIGRDPDAMWPPASHRPFVYLKDTNDMEAIERAVYGEDHLAHQYVGRNPRLTEVHCRRLITTLTDILDRAVLINNRLFPTDLLAELALSDEDPFILGVIATHPNIDEDTQIVLALWRLS
jgi:hypothetical protein